MAFISQVCLERSGNGGTDRPASDVASSMVIATRNVPAKRDSTSVAPGLHQIPYMPDNRIKYSMQSSDIDDHSEHRVAAYADNPNLTMPSPANPLLVKSLDQPCVTSDRLREYCELMGVSRWFTVDMRLQSQGSQLIPTIDLGEGEPVAPRFAVDSFISYLLARRSIVLSFEGPDSEPNLVATIRDHGNFMDVFSPNRPSCVQAPASSDINISSNDHNCVNLSENAKVNRAVFSDTLESVRRLSFDSFDKKTPDHQIHDRNPQESMTDGCDGGPDSGTEEKLYFDCTQVTDIQGEILKRICQRST